MAHLWGLHHTTGDCLTCLFSPVFLTLADWGNTVNCSQPKEHKMNDSNGVLESIITFQSAEHVYGACSLVCKRWNQIVNFSKSFHLLRNKQPPTQLLKNKNHVTLHQNDHLIPYLPFETLTYLELSHLSSIHHLHLPLHTLQHLSLKFLRDLTKLTFEQDVHHLESLSLHSCSKVDVQDLIRVLERSPPLLKKLELISMKQTISWKDTLFMKNVKKLDLRLSTGSDVTSMLQHCQELQYLDLSKWKSLQNNNIDSIAANNKLISVCLWSCDQIDDNGIKALVSSTKHTLRHVNISCCKKITDNSLKYLSSCDLVRLQLWWCINISDEGICSLNLPNLESLNLNWVSSITDASLLHISRFKSLKTLMLAKCSNITDRGLIEVAINCKQLQQIDIAECCHVSSTTIEQLAMHCSDLRQINVNQCCLIDDTSICQLALKLKSQLEGLNVGSTKCSSETLREVLFHCSEGISVLDVSNCNISDRTVQEIINSNVSLAHLVTLNLKGCNISDQLVQQLKQKLNNTNVLI
jgi:hypothetical protein